jgi:hypothetical protein
MTFPQSQLWKVIDDTTNEPLGSFLMTSADADLRYITLPLLKVGTMVGAEQFRLVVWTDAALTEVYVISDWTILGGVIPATGAWRGEVRFDFNFKPLATSTTYHLTAEAANYTRNGDTFYVAFGLNHPFELVGSGYGGSCASVYVNRRVSYGVG